jgi:F-type H+-transporting ATPase subunit alpha
VITIYGATQGYCDQVRLDQVGKWEKEMIRFMDTHYPQIIQSIDETLRLTEQNEAILKEALGSFNRGWEG